jgi:hypothetical protein
VYNNNTIVVRKKLTLLLSLITISIAVNAQISPDDMSKYLTNSGRRIWIFKDYRTNFGSCSGIGQSFEFSIKGKLAWKKCNNGELEYKTVEWKITPVYGRTGEYIITFNKPIEIEKGIQISSAQIHFVSPKINTKDIKMYWNVPNCQKCLEPVVELRSKN